MQKPMTGVRVLEVAQFTFVPSAGAVLADWGADVIKIENPVTGDAQRGLVTGTGHGRRPLRHGAGSLVLADDGGTQPQAQRRPFARAEPDSPGVRGTRQADVFLTNLLPQARAKLRIDLDENSTHQPRHRLRGGRRLRK